jgi:hypothetical protein
VKNFKSYQVRKAKQKREEEEKVNVIRVQDMQGFRNALDTTRG